MVALAYPIPHDPENPDDHGPYLLPDGTGRGGGRRAGSVGGQPGAARPSPPNRSPRPAGRRPAGNRPGTGARRPESGTGRPLGATLAAGVYWRRRLLVATGVALGIWLTAAAVGGLTTALRGLESRPLTVPELAGAGQLASATAPQPTPASGVGAGAPLRAGQSYVVQPGETLWDIARRLQPTGDIRPLVDRLASAHGRGPLQIGERLLLP